MKRALTLCCGLILGCAGVAQLPSSTPSYAKRLPYAFSNFVWWSDDELRSQLVRRLPGLGDEISPVDASETRIRQTLIAMLKEKGIVAEIQIQEPSTFDLTAQRAPGVPAPAILFKIMSPQITVKSVFVSGISDADADQLRGRLRRLEGQSYSNRQDWLLRQTAMQLFEPNGYLDCTSEVIHDAPQKNGADYSVNVLVDVHPGPQYHISEITADGGPLLAGQDLSQYITARPGDIAGQSILGRPGAALRTLYSQHGYADVSIEAPPIFDREHAKVAYHLHVIPGPLYHLRTLMIRNLSDERQDAVRQAFEMQAGDVYNDNLISSLYRKLASDPQFAGLSFSFIPLKNPESGTVDLTLNFFKQTDKSTVTVK